MECSVCTNSAQNQGTLIKKKNQKLTASIILADTWKAAYIYI